MPTTGSEWIIGVGLVRKVIRPEVQLGHRDFFWLFTLRTFCSFLLQIPCRLNSLSYLILAVPMRNWSVEHSCMSSTFPIYSQNEYGRGEMVHNLVEASPAKD